MILDCTDNAPTRYLLSDTAVRLGVPLVSGAAQRLEGQLCTYNLAIREASADAPSAGSEGSREKRGPCDRCLFPRPPAPGLVGSCAETGILGAVTGVIGTLQAVEAIKIITGLGGWSFLHILCKVHSLLKRCATSRTDCKPSLLIYSALASPPFRHIKLRDPRKTCVTCGEMKTPDSVLAFDYVAFCGGPQPNWTRRGMEIMEGCENQRIRAKVCHWLIF